MMLVTSPQPPRLPNALTVSSHFLARLQLLIRYASLPWEGHPTDLVV
jgi:hypothetical protein